MRILGTFAAMTFLIVAGTAQQGTTSITQPSQRLDPVISKAISEVSEARIAEIEKKLESFETRNSMSDPGQAGRGVGAARQWIFEQFQSYSPSLQVAFDTHMVPKGGRVWKEVEMRNVVATLPGKTDPERGILVGGHYDSLNLHIPPELKNDPAKAAEITAPGVTDDGSGTACAMECARILSQYEFNATLVFVAFVGEEQGLVGARAMARRLREKNQSIEALLNNDIIGSDVSGNGVTDNHRILVFSEGPEDSPSREIARFVKLIGERYYPELVVQPVFRHDRFGRGGDQTAFNQEGYAAIRITTPCENYANQHSATDSFANTSPAYAAKVIRLNTAIAAAMALAPRPPITMPQAGEPSTRLGGPGAPGISRGDGYDAVLRWDYPYPQSDLAGFIVVMRPTTSPYWEREIWAGNVRELTLKNTPIDQYVFGVKSVDREGHESPVAAYWTQPRKTYQ